MNVHDYVYDGPDPEGGSGARAREPLHVRDKAAPPARERRRELGVPDDAECARLAAWFGPVLRSWASPTTRSVPGCAPGFGSVLARSAATSRSSSRTGRSCTG